MKKRLAYRMDTQSNNNPSSHAPKSMYHHHFRNRFDDSDDKLSSRLLNLHSIVHCLLCHRQHIQTIKPRNEAHKANKKLTDPQTTGLY